MKRPVFRAEAARDTNAPLSLVAGALRDTAAWKHWCIAPRAATVSPTLCEDGGIEIRYTQTGPLGLTLEGTLRAIPTGTRVILEHQATFRGWAILMLLGWYRWRIEHMWERFIQTLPPPESI